MTTGAALLLKEIRKRELWPQLVARLKYSEDQPRDDHGRWTDGGGVVDTSSAAFRAWFGASKVVNTDGSPKVVYHGTPKAFTEFTGDQIFFSADPNHAAFFSGGMVISEGGPRDRAPVIMPVYLSIQNPRVADGSRTRDSVQFAQRQIDAARHDGRDGVIIRSLRDANAGTSDVYVAFRPTQVKSATSNTGAFSAHDAHIGRALKFNDCHDPHSGEFCSGGGGEWQPSMSETAANQWSSSGAMPGRPFYHFTNSEATRAAIEQEGFKTSNGIYGQGIYLTEDAERVGYGLEANRDLRMEVRTNATRIETVTGFKGMVALTAQHGVEDPHELLAKAGIQAVHILFPSSPGGKGWLLVFDTHALTVVKAPAKAYSKALAEDFGDDLPALTRLIERLEPALRRRFLASLAQVQNAMDMERLADAIERNSLGDALSAAKVAEFPERYGGLATDLRAGFIAGAAYTIRELAQSRIQSSFTLINQRAVEYAANTLPHIVNPFQDGAKEVIAREVADALAGNQTPKGAAMQIRDFIGLTPQQAAANDAKRQALIDKGNSGALLEKRMQRYTDAQIRQRADVIARTEVHRAAGAGQLAAWKDAAAKGLLNPAEWGRVWHTTHDERLCDACEPMDGVVVEGLEGQFTKNKDGEAVDNSFGEPMSFADMHPNCRCTITLEKL